MKTKIILMAMVVGAIWQTAVAADPNNNTPTAQTKAQPAAKPKPVHMSPLPLIWKQSTVANNGEIDRLGSMSSRAWGTIANSAMENSVFQPERTGPIMAGSPLFYVGHEPWP